MVQEFRPAPSGVDDSQLIGAISPTRAKIYALLGAAACVWCVVNNPLAASEPPMLVASESLGPSTAELPSFSASTFSSVTSSPETSQNLTPNLLPAVPVHAPASYMASGGEAWNAPSLVVTAQALCESLPLIEIAEHKQEIIPPQASIDEMSVIPVESFVGESMVNPARSQPGLTAPIQRLLGRQFGVDKGIGHERVMYAPLVLDTAVGTPNVALKFRSDRGLATPDRLEYYWATPGRGPAAESRVDILDSVLRMELGNSRAMLLTEYTMRAVNPERNDNTVGFGDMVIGAKGLVIDGRCTKVATIFRTYLKTGPDHRGLGTGHVSLEPGLLWRHQWRPATFLHGELKYWLPIAGTRGVAGDVLKTGFGVSTIWRESDCSALLPTLEFSTYSFLAGGTTDSLGASRHVNGDFAAEIFPGLRYVLVPHSDLGMIEFGTAFGATVADRNWFDNRAIFEIRMIR